PAHFGETDDIIINSHYQKQFSKLEHSPNTQSIGAHANVTDRLGVGAYFFRDQNGPISANGINIGAAYFIPIDDNERKNQFSFGTSIN
ncbi:type IX secretion system membrane protein PorP/SprF, partial [Escherichia coli]|nr:type IX secretion system membrane protein PorP/SprF [Escherichia coli]